MPAELRRLIRPLVAGAAVLSALAPAPAGATDPAGGCRTPVLERATRGSDVLAASADDLAAAAQINDVGVRNLSAQVSTDQTLWLDICGRAFNVEPADPPHARRATAADAPTATTDPGSLSSALLLESNPGADRTIYLDFIGGTVTGTAWNDSYATPTMTVAPYSVTAPADTAFTSAELAEIQKAWQVVAEDFASFDVNVTTKPPAAGAIERTGPADTTYGTRVLITGGGMIYDACRCGGVSYVGTFDLTEEHEYYQPAWVFTQGTSTSGRRLGEAASHEAGHTLGLRHDGAATAYYAGSPPWAPIMGTSYNQPVTQWSAGEYAGATNTEDDVALIAAQLGILADDHADTGDGATALGSTPLDGVITTRTDTDAFTFTAGGPTTLTATPGPGYPDLDLGLRILDSSGALIADVDPPVARVGPSSATGLDATWTAALPETPTTYTAVVDGVGSGDPLTPGNYSDYASLGHYRIALGGDTSSGVPLTVASTTPGPATVGVPYTAVPASASGGRTPYAWSATGLATGLSLDPDEARVAGNPSSSGSFSVTVTVTDATSASATTTFLLTVAPSPRPSAPPVPEVTAVPTVPPSDVGSVPVADTAFGFATRAHLRAAHLHRRYRARIRTLGAHGAVTWSRSGTLPRGLRVVSRASGNALVTGRPDEAGRYVLRLVATDATGARIVRRFTLRVRR